MNGDFGGPPAAIPSMGSSGPGGAAVDRVLSALEAAGCSPRRSGSGKWQARCPAPVDRSRSLSVGVGDGRALVHCFADCHIEDVVGACGLALTDLFDDRRAPSVGTPSRPPRAPVGRGGPSTGRAEDVQALRENGFGPLMDDDLPSTAGRAPIERGTAQKNDDPAGGPGVAKTKAAGTGHRRARD